MDSKELLKKALEALEAMQQEFRALDLPYGSKAYDKSTDTALEIKAFLEKRE